MADLTVGGYSAADFELLGGTVDGMDVDKLSQDELAVFIQERVKARNAAVNLIVGELSLPTLKRGALMGQDASMGDWPKGTEQDRGRRRKTSGLAALGFPVNKFGPFRTGYTRDYLAKATNFEILRHFEGLMAAHLSTNWKEAMRALFQDTQWSWQHDEFPEDGALVVKPLLNADGYISPDWQANVFDGTEDHYLAHGTGTLDEADLEAATALLRQYGYGVSTNQGGLGGRIETWINSAEEADVRAHTGFVPANDPVVINMNKIFAGGIDQDVYIGYNSAARTFIRVVDFIPADYELTFVTDSQPNAAMPVDRVNSFAPLRRRLPTTAALQGIQLVTESKFPLQESFMEDWFGYGVGRRNSAVIGQIAASYAVPTIA